MNNRGRYTIQVETKTWKALQREKLSSGVNSLNKVIQNIFTEARRSRRQSLATNNKRRAEPSGQPA